MEELLHEIAVRRAKRALREDPVPEEVLERVLTAATCAPSCFNNQPWRFVVINDMENLEAVRGFLSSGNYWAKKAPVVVLAATKADLDCRLSEGRNYAFFDLGQAVQSMILQATKEGLIAHPIAGFKPLEIKQAFGIPQEYTLLTLVIIGYPGSEDHLNDKHKELEHSERSRKDQSEVVFFNGWINP